MKWSEAAQSCPTLCNPMDCSLPGSSVPGILQAGILGWVAISFSRRSSQPRDRTWVSCIAGRRFTIWATREVSTLHLRVGHYCKFCGLSCRVIWWSFYLLKGLISKVYSYTFQFFFKWNQFCLSGGGMKDSELLAILVLWVRLPWWSVSIFVKFC